MLSNACVRINAGVGFTYPRSIHAVQLGTRRLQARAQAELLQLLSVVTGVAGQVHVDGKTKRTRTLSRHPSSCGMAQGFTSRLVISESTRALPTLNRSEFD
jgi:hypothetical protein